MCDGIACSYRIRSHRPAHPTTSTTNLWTHMYYYHHNRTLSRFARQVRQHLGGGCVSFALWLYDLQTSDHYTILSRLIQNWDIQRKNQTLGYTNLAWLKNYSHINKQQLKEQQTLFVTDAENVWRLTAVFLKAETGTLRLKI